jgi:hypothetical protein
VTAAVLFAVMALVLWIHDDGEPSWGPHVVVPLTPAPDRKPLAVAASRTPIKHIVFLVKENRTYDNLFGLYPGADGTRYGIRADGSTMPLRPLPDKQTDLQHSYFAAHHDINGGKMNGFSTLRDTRTQPRLAPRRRGEAQLGQQGVCLIVTGHTDSARCRSLSGVRALVLRGDLQRSLGPSRGLLNMSE